MKHYCEQDDASRLSNHKYTQLMRMSYCVTPISTQHTDEHACMHAQAHATHTHTHTHAPRSKVSLNTDHTQMRDRKELSITSIGFSK